jgi:hypothetical protein
MQYFLTKGIDGFILKLTLIYGRNKDLKLIPEVGMETENPFPLQNKL